MSIRVTGPSPYSPLRAVHPPRVAVEPDHGPVTFTIIFAGVFCGTVGFAIGLWVRGLL